MEQPTFNLICHKLQERLRLPCIEGFAKELLTHGSPVAPVDALGFCQLSILTEPEHDICFRFIASQLPEWASENQVGQICSSLEDKYKRLCRGY